MTIHGLWIGPTLSRLEQLTLKSFLRWGHPFQLWVYDEPTTPLPHGVELKDAAEILPRERIFAKRERDPETGVGEGSYSPFSDLFRYKLLHDKGGVWVDMDVTCLRPFDFNEPYVFRPHRLGVIGNLMKCPQGCELMRRCYEDSERIADENVDWLAQVRILNHNVERLGLTGFVRPDISNVDSWDHSVRSFVEQRTPIPDRWYAIHWLNEHWRSLRARAVRGPDGTQADDAPDKDAPPVGGTLHDLYRHYGLVDASADEIPQQTTTPPPVGEPLDFAPRASETRLNIVVPSLVRGGAERTIVETVNALAARPEVRSAVYLMGRAQKGYKIAGAAQLTTFDGDWSEAAFRTIALQALASPTPVVFTHLLRAQHLAHLWRLGVSTIPVIHNARAGWPETPTAYNHERVPFVIAVADAIAAQLKESGCTRPVLTIRHELQRWFDPADLARQRREIRDVHGLSDDTLLIGMVGEFKSQKAYTRAVRVLSAVQRNARAKLMILGDWDQEYGSGRATYEATCRLALDLGVMADLLTPGNIHPVDPYFSAFDVFLNTSVYEGLPIALLEAAQAGCPIVAADVGGVREALPIGDTLVSDASDIAAYADGVLSAARRRVRDVRSPPAEPDLIPRLWALLAKYCADGNGGEAGAAGGTLFVTHGLHVGGPARALTNLLTRLSTEMKVALCAVEGGSVNSLRRAVEAAQVPILDLADARSLTGKAEQVLAWMRQLNLGTLCFWNTPPELKLLLSKVLSVSSMRLVDVSPGPMLFDELEAAADFQRRIAWDGNAYLSRLDDFVALYAGGAPMGQAQPRRVSVIPRGVRKVPRSVPLPPADAMLSAPFDPALAIGTCCRIVPDKRIDFLIDMMAEVHARAPGSSLTIVGGPDANSLDYWERLRARVEREDLACIRFVGSHEDVNPFLAQFQVFVMVSNRQGCPNASLEAMAMGLPVVANPDGGTAEQVVDGVTGFLVEDSAAMAARVVELLRNPDKRRRFGAAGRARALELFSLEGMVERYASLLGARAGALPCD